MNLKKNFLTILVLLGMFLPVVYVFKYENDKKKEISITHPSASDPHAHPSVTIVYHTQIPDSLKAVLKSVVMDYHNKYILYDTLWVSDTSISETHSGDTMISTILAIGKPREICLNKVALKTTWLEKFKYTIAHELFHTLKSKVPATVTPYYVDKNTSIVSYSGLNLGSNSDFSKHFTMIEEAGAEACAYALYRGYKSKNPQYYNVGDLMLTMLDSNWITPIDLINATRTSNPIKLFGLILNRSEKEVEVADVVGMMDIFNLAWNNQIFSHRLQAISMYRNHK